MQKPDMLQTFGWLPEQFSGLADFSRQNGLHETSKLLELAVDVFFKEIAESPLERDRLTPTLTAADEELFYMALMPQMTANIGDSNVIDLTNFFRKRLGS